MRAGEPAPIPLAGSRLKNGKLWAAQVTVSEEGFRVCWIQDDCGANATDSPEAMR